MPTEIANKSKTNRRGNPNWKRGGASPNPRGRPSAGMSWAELIKAEGELWHKRSGMTRKQWLIKRAYDHAAGGNAAILRELMQRSEPQGAEATGKLTIEIIRESTTAPADAPSGTAAHQG